MARPRIGDVAERAGVSKTAVSFAFNKPDISMPRPGRGSCSPPRSSATGPSPIARRLAARRTRQIGLVVPQSSHDVFANPFLPELVRGIGDVCDAEGIAVVIVPPLAGSHGHGGQGGAGRRPHPARAARRPPELDQLERSGLPVVALDVESWGGADGHRHR